MNEPLAIAERARTVRIVSIESKTKLARKRFERRNDRYSSLINRLQPRFDATELVESKPSRAQSVGENSIKHRKPFGV
jgi:hypothetical protein